MTRKTVRLTVDVLFDGEYYDEDEVITVSNMWITETFADRDDVVLDSLKVTGTVTEEA